jgi:hypothetical protein
VKAPEAFGLKKAWLGSYLFTGAARRGRAHVNSHLLKIIGTEFRVFSIRDKIIQGPKSATKLRSAVSIFRSVEEFGNV